MRDAAGTGATPAEPFYFAAKKIGIRRRSLMRRDRRHSGGFLLRIMPPSWHPVPACTPRFCCRRAILPCDHNKAAGGPFINAATTAAGGPFFFDATEIRIGRGIVAATTDEGGPFYFAATKIGIGRVTVAATTAQAGHSTCRNDGTAVILDLRGSI